MHTIKNDGSHNNFGSRLYELTERSIETNVVCLSTRNGIDFRFDACTDEAQIVTHLRDLSLFLIHFFFFFK